MQPTPAQSFDGLADLEDVTMDEDATPSPISITNVSTGGGADESTQTVTFTATSSDATIVPDPTFSGSGDSRVMTFTPVAEANGVVTITVTGTDDGGSSPETEFDSFTDTDDVESFRRAAVDEMLPPFPEAVLEQTIPDPGVRAQFREDLRSTPLEVYEEPIPVPEGWPDAAVAYLGFSKSRDAYRASIKTAVEGGWTFSELEGAHFHMLVDPGRVARALLDLARKCGVEVEQEPAG